MSEALLEVQSLQVAYGDHVALRDVTLDVRDGERFVLIGASGCGKTTLLRTIAGFERPSTGEVRLSGETISSSAQHLPPEQRRIGMVFQQAALFPHLTVSQNVAFGVAGDRSRVDDVLGLTGIAALADRYPDQLSGGQQQLVALARALAPRPRLILFDEPFASLDAERRGRIREQVLQVLDEAQATAIFVTHDQEEAFLLGDRIALLDEGRLVQLGTPRELYEQPASLHVARFIGIGSDCAVEVRAGSVETPWGALATSLSDGSATLFSRPEAFRLDASSSVEATLITSRYSGHEWLFTVELANGMRCRLRESAHAERRDVGETVRIAADLSRFHLLR